MATVSSRKLKGHIHPIVILNSADSAIEACVISHDQNNGNIPLCEKHFNNDPEYSVTFDNTNPSYLVNAKFIKLKEDLQANVVGKLTDEGITFIENKMKDVRGEVLNKPIWKK